MSKKDERTDDFPDLILENDFRVRNAFDPHICSVSLRAKTNNPSDGFDLSLSSVFGSERVRIAVDDEEIEFLFEIYKAEILVDPVHCHFDPAHERDETFASPLPATPLDLAGTHSKRTSRFKIDTGSLLDTITGGGRVEYEATAEGTKIAAPSAWYERRFLNDHTIQITSRGKTPVPLNGALIEDYIGWRVLPKKDRDSGVLARVRVREDWISLSEPSLLGREGTWWSLISSLIASESKELETRRKAFHLLLTHLVELGLQHSGETRDATLAFDTVLVRRNADYLQRAEGLPPKEVIRVDGSVLGQFLTSKFGMEVETLKMIGVPTSRLADLMPDTTRAATTLSPQGIWRLAFLRFLRKLRSGEFKNYALDAIHESLRRSVFVDSIVQKRNVIVLGVAEQRRLNILLDREGIIDIFGDLEEGNWEGLLMALDESEDLADRGYLDFAQAAEIVFGGTEWIYDEADRLERDIYKVVYRQNA